MDLAVDVMAYQFPDVAIRRLKEVNTTERK
jgi:hypothetical protein